MKALRVTGNVFILIGATFLFFVVYELIGTSAITAGHQRALAAEFEEPDDDPVVVEPSPPPEPTETKEPEPPPPPRPKLGSPVARLRIPSIDVDMIMVEGTSLDELAKGPGHYRGTPLPGQRGPVGVAGHRTGWGSPFIDLDRLGRGDRIIIDLKDDQRFVYEVTNTRVVDPGDVWVLNGDPRSDAEYSLTLTTCTPKYTSRNRLIVWADQVSPDPTPERVVPHTQPSP